MTDIAAYRSFRQLARCGARRLRVAAVSVGLVLLVVHTACGQQLLPGEFGGIELGRPLIEPTKFPTVGELRELVRRPTISPVLMLKLYGDDNNHHMPIWSSDGQRLAFQRTTRGSDASKLLIYTQLSATEPTLLSSAPDAFDLMFRWGINNPNGFVFSRIDATKQSTDVMYSSDGETVDARTSAGHALYASLFTRTDGVNWLAFERDGDVYHQAWGRGQLEEQKIARGASPLWSRDGKRLLLVREVDRRGDLGEHQLLIRTVGGKATSERTLDAPTGGMLRSPVWSPTETHVASYWRSAGEGSPWQIIVSPTGSDGSFKSLASDVVVNPSFRSEGPSWEPSGRRIWCFSQQKRRQEYFPLLAVDASSGAAVTVDYSERCTTPFDAAVNPATKSPELAFVAHTGLSQDLFVLLLNHF